MRLDEADVNCPIYRTIELSYFTTIGGELKELFKTNREVREQRAKRYNLASATVNGLRAYPRERKSSAATALAFK